MTTTVTDNRDEQRFEIHVDGARAGIAEYRRREGVIALTHTEVDPGHEGQGLAGRLVRGALDDARSQGLAVHPHCPFVRDYIAKHDEYLDLVPEDQRARFDL
ncbi:GNAT family N-acetyltransferase [Prauserella rugosa]|uniref:N-acetyltransferase domain-containing protein n=1 Tax=Prauserella rugosa TaxID=43354 RepID=A0A660CHH5_9PSEU|nr:GNAT family N-acetyltransferase [Prauserella rugosa]KID29323.1 putative acetyltransferase [Prauserella sp. Am3]KMS91978.1 hypothetical protein ACZ91_06690 [Streptomyces regensis]TWH21317.1 hypothetical protein JD82_03176 [Prauserella rugosa]